jgi:hypothetical protein
MILWSGKHNGKVAEHRLVMAQHLGRCLSAEDVVHHINGKKDDNRIANLRLLNKHSHHPMIALQELWTKNADLEKRVTALESENVLLRSFLQEVRDSVPDNPELKHYNTLGSLLDEQIEGIVQASSNGGDKTNLNRRSRVCRNRQPQMIGASVGQLADKLVANSGNSKTCKGQDNPELNGDSNVS